MLTFFCPGCWTEIREADVICPSCGHNLSDYVRLPYEEKLILALSHPLKENRMMAICLLGDLKSRGAVAAFESLIKTETDFYVLREVARSLTKIGDGEGWRIVRQLREHPSDLVRMVAEDALAGQKL